jgi:hypothetical protein
MRHRHGDKKHGEMETWRHGYMDIEGVDMEKPENGSPGDFH